MARKAQIEEVPETVEPAEVPETGKLLVVNFIQCDGVAYQPGSEFPLDHRDAERLFDAGALKMG